MERSSKDYQKESKKKIVKSTSVESNVITRINIDSRHRNIESKNIINGNIQYLENNPISLISQESNCHMIVKHKNHSLEINDNIIVQGAISASVILDNSITFIGNNSFARINHKNHGLNFDTENEMFVFISGFQGNLNSNTTFNNIPINEINTLHKIYSVKDKSEIYNGDYYYIFMNGIISNFSSIYNLSTLFITFKDIYGIDLSYINANYPLDSNHLQGYHTIIDTTLDSYTIQLSIGNNIDIFNKGGDKVWIAKVSEFIQGYPNINQYTIPLRKTFKNITKISLISTEIPNTEKAVKGTGLKKNNMFYWKHENDGNVEYSIEIQPGNYSVELGIKN